MIEIILIWKLTGYIGRMATQKGLKKIRYQIMSVLLWICGETMGGILGILIFGSQNSPWLVYGMALLGALAGAGLAFLIMKSIPEIDLDSDTEATAIPKQKSGRQIFERSIWIPSLVIFLSLACLLLVYSGFYLLTRNVAQQIQDIQARNPVIGVELNSNGTISQSVNEISPRTEVIYFGFDSRNTLAHTQPVTINLNIDGNPYISFTTNINAGQAIVPLERDKLTTSTRLKRGNYEVMAYFGDILLTSASFVIK